MHSGARHSAHTTIATSHLPSQRCPGRAIFPGAGCTSGSPEASSPFSAALCSEPLRRPSSAAGGLEVLPSRRLRCRSSPPGRPGGLTGQPPPTWAWASASEGSFSWALRCRTRRDGGSAPPGDPARFHSTPRDGSGLRALSPTGSSCRGLGGRPDASTVLGSLYLGKSGGLPTTQARSPGSRLGRPGTGSVPPGHTGTPGYAPPDSFYFSAGPARCT
ncbi:hypothetical protein P7K49_038571 [Saguinus oedipus]|uniref:Uncharacterized protein n=1 Tax=Saguinus oedipus TaxID=9490 RepID=A0ABQ9TFM8_SAGOE|nr:hypothetical protein P7K49_038571 [Saguinus oedipus]